MNRVLTVYQAHKDQCLTWTLSFNMGLPWWLMGKNLPTEQERQETWVRALGQEDPLEKGMATHSSMLAWRILWTEEPGGLQSMALQRIRYY